MRLGCAATLVAWLVAAPVAAEPRPRVAVAAPDDADGLLRESGTRLGAELRSAGFDVVAVGQEDAIATFSLARAPGGTAAVDVSVTDRLTHKTSTRRIEADAATGELAPATLAIRAVELLRASLVELGTPGEPSSAPIPVAVEELVAPLRQAPPKNPVAGNAVAIGGGLLLGTDGLAPAPCPVVRASLGLHHRWALRLTAAAPGLAETIDAAAGSAAVRQDLAALELVFALRSGDAARVVPYVSVGGGVFHLNVKGTSAGEPFVGRDDDEWAALVSGGAGVALRLGARAALLADVSAIATLPGGAIDVGGAIVARAGRPAILTSLGVSWAL